MAAGSGGRERFTYHGGDLAAARAAFPDAPQPWLDLSTGVNPVPYPVPTLPLSAWTALPDADASAALERAAGRAYGVDPARMAAGPGSGALVRWLARLSPARRVGVLGLTYGDHARAWRDAGARVDVVETVGALGGFDVAVVVNPNNPDGRLIPPDQLRGLAGSVGLLVVDEAFADVVPAALSLAPAPPDNAVVLRSFGKFYGLAGVRLAFAATSPGRAAALRAALGPWPISGPALAAGAAALADDGWATGARARLAVDAARLDALLLRGGARVAGGTTLFRLADVGGAERWFEALARAGILTRPFSERPTWLRFGLPGREIDWARLERAMHGLTAEG